MQNKVVPFILALVVAALAQESGTPKTAAPSPLVRRDLLPVKAREFPPVKRDLFSLQSYAATTGAPVSGPGFVTRPPEALAKPEEALPPVFALRYLGYIVNQARTKVVGLVMFEGRMAAVEAGDILGQGWKILRVTAKDIEVESPDGQTRTFAFEGELR